MAAETDALLVHTAAVAGNYHLFAADRDFGADGDVQVDIVSLTEAPGVSMSVTNASLRAYATELRDVDATVAAHLLDGAFVEGADGYVTIDTTATMGWQLRDVADLRRLEGQVNWSRGELFGQFVSAADITAPDAPELGSVARVCAELWAAAR